MTSTRKDGSGSAADQVLDATLPAEVKLVALDETIASSVSGPGTPNVNDDHSQLVAVDPSHYRIIKEIARGGMGRIQIGRDRRLGRTVAVKEMLQRDGELAMRFEREARITARLQHPSIVGVYEAGVWPNGFPFYSMPRVNGRSFDEVIADQRTLRERLSLVPNVLAIADAMAYAHGERVIHRDLKPKNVLIGSFGETVVIDWGLAKDLASAQPDPDAGPYRTPAASLETVVGEVMGTPAYMPPEQAEGESVDERADVYAIGAILMHVLTGTPPYEGRSAVAILDAVRAGPPTSIRERAPDAPPDLVAIVERAMARTPALRYRTAKELAEDVRRFQTGQLVGAYRYSLAQLLRRWIAKHRTPIAVAAVAFVLVVGIGVVSVRRVIIERERADTARVVAEENRHQAEDLTDFMMGDMRSKLQAVGKLDLLDVVARKAMSYYDRGAASSDLGRRATAMVNIGDVLVAQGDQPAARQSYSRALGLRLAQSLASAMDDGTAEGMSEIYAKLGDVTLAQGSSPGALALYEQARAIIEPRMSLNAPSWHRAFSELQVRAAGVSRTTGDLAGAHRRLESAMRSLKVVEAALGSDPARSKKMRARIENELATVLTDQSQLENAIERRKAALSILEDLAAKSPQDTTLLVDVAATANHLGDELEMVNQATAELASYKRALAVYEGLVAHDPTNAKWRADLAVTHMNLARALTQLGDLSAALTQATAAQVLAEDILARDPSNAEALRRVGSVHVARANAHRSATGSFATGDHGIALDGARRALPEFDKAIDLLRRVVQLDPMNRDALRDLAIVRADRAQTLVLLSDLDSAEREYSAALLASQQLSETNPLNAWWRADIGHVHVKLGQLLRERGRLDEALAEYAKAISIQEGLSIKDPANIEWRREVAMTRTYIGNLRFDRRSDRADVEAAVAAYAAALDAARQMAVAAPDDAVTGQVVTYLEGRVTVAMKLLAEQK